MKEGHRVAFFLSTLAILTVTASAACGASPLVTRQARPTPPVPSAPHVLAGVARADITPPPGLSLFGHGPEGRVSAGVRLRLYCRAFVLVSGSEAVALVPCDLGAPSLELQRRVANLLVERGIPIGASRLLLMATHTHAGPAHYFGPRLYSSALASREPGFDPRVLEFLAVRIASAVMRAYASRVPARIGWAYDRHVHDLTRNRSYAAFSANFRTDNDALVPAEIRAAMESTNLRSRFSPSQLAVDPQLSVLRIDRVDPAEPLGVLAVFGMHPTAIANTNDLYHGDVFGFATRKLERALTDLADARRPEGSVHRDPESGCEQTGPDTAARCPVIVGIANGIEGDVSPMWDFQAPREARRLGEKLATAILAAHATLDAPGALSADAPIRRLYRELYLPHARIDGAVYRELHCRYERDPATGQSRCTNVPGNVEPRLCDGPQIGVAAAAGAEDGPTRFRALPVFQEGSRRELPQVCHGRRKPLIAPGGLPGDDGLDFPSVAPIELLRIGSGLVAAAPAELTTVTGMLIRRQIVRELSRAPAPFQPAGVAVVGLTNQYLQYVTTPWEYELQHYEGASTLYGPGSAAFLVGHFGCLARVLHGESDRDCALGQAAIDSVLPVAYSPSEEVSRLPEEPSAIPETVTLQDVDVARVPEDGLPGWLVRWAGVPPATWLVDTRLGVRIERAAPGQEGTLEDTDRGSSMAVRYVGNTERGENTWSAHWVPAFHPGEAQCGMLFRFVVVGAVSVRSRPFRVTCGGMEPATAQTPPPPPPAPESQPASAP